MVVENTDNDFYNICKSIDNIYDTIEKLFRTGYFKVVDNILKDIDVSEAHTDLLISYLTATLPGKQKLTNRNNFYMRVKKELEVRHHNYNIENLLLGLK